MLQQDNGFGIHDLAIANGLQRPRQRPLQHFNVLTFRRQPAALSLPVIGLIFGDKKVEFFGDRSGAHKDGEDGLDARHPKAGLLFRFGNDPRLRRGVIQQPGRRFNEISVVTVSKHRKTELTSQDHRSLFPVVE